MNCSFQNGVSASYAIKYMQHRLSAGQTPSANVQPKTSKDLDQIIAHMRSRLKSHAEWPRPEFPERPL